MENKQIKGFTLIELLVVIGIVAILSAVVILTLNPAELLKQSRDSNRLSDMATLKSAISLYLADVTVPVIGTSTPEFCHVTYQQPVGIAPEIAVTTCGGLFSGTNTFMSSTAANLRRVDGGGWIPVDMTKISSGAPVGNLPVDPSNTATYYYAYKSGPNLTFEIDVAKMESTKFASSSEQDGGNINTTYEVGTDPGLNL